MLITVGAAATGATGLASTIAAGAAATGAAGVAAAGLSVSKDLKSSPSLPNTAMIASTGTALPSSTPIYKIVPS